MRTKNIQPIKRSRHLVAQAKSPGSNQHPAPSAKLPQRALPRESVEKAKSTFKNFSLSRFGKEAVPANYVDRRRAKDPTAVQTRQRELITQQLNKLPQTDTQNPGMTLAFPSAKLQEIKKSLPGIEKDGGSIQLDDLLKYMQGKMNGTDFYSSGNPVLRRLTVETQLRSQARGIIDSIMKHTGVPKAEPAPASKSATKGLAPQSAKG